MSTSTIPSESHSREYCFLSNPYETTVTWHWIGISARKIGEVTRRPGFRQASQPRALIRLQARVRLYVQ